MLLGFEIEFDTARVLTALFTQEAVILWRSDVVVLKGASTNMAIIKGKEEESKRELSPCLYTLVHKNVKYTPE